MTDYTSRLVDAVTEVLATHAQNSKTFRCVCGEHDIRVDSMQRHQAAMVVARLGAQARGWRDREHRVMLFSLGVLSPERNDE